MNIHPATCPFTPLVGPIGEATEIDHGSPMVYYKSHLDGRAGFLVVWPMGTRLWIQTHDVGYQAIYNAVPMTWWADPAQQTEETEKAA